LSGLHELGGIGVLRNLPAVLNQHLKNEIFFLAKAHLESFKYTGKLRAG